MVRNGIVFPLVVALGLAWATLGAAEETAETHYLQALDLFNQGRYVDALERFDQAIVLSPDAVFYCNRAVVLLELGQTRDALESMDVCRTGFENADPEERAQVDAEVNALSLAVRHIVPDARALASTIAFTRSRPTVANAPAVTIVAAPAGGEELDSAELAAWGAGAAGALSLTAALILDLVTLPLIDEYRASGREGRSRSSYDGLRRAIDQRQVLIGSLLVAGVVSGGASALLFWWNKSSRAESVDASVSVGPGGALIHVGASF
jgi:tetratricopeptide (TPR) repeat protein